MIRKDVLPEVTVKTIQSILKENGIDALISNNKSYKEGWYSCSLEITGLKDISTNGKGVELNHAYASAYAEMLERIQSGLLLDGLFPEKVNTSKSEDISDELMDIYESYFNHIIQDYNKDKAEKLLQYNKKFCVLSSYFDVIRKNVVELPDKFISALCGSNGVSSGNSKEEAFVQGTCEVFERYINYIIHHEEYNADKFPIIDEKYFSNTYAYTLIKKIEKKGLKVIVKDCTLNGLFPVIGVLVMNMSRTKYYFAIGSDINLDICIQRCITEMFQGKDINIDFRYHMHSIVEQYDNFWYLKNKRNEYAKSVRDGRGKLPRRFFLGESKDYYNGIIEPFEYNNISNKDAAVRINQILAKLKVNVYIKDYSYLEFDTLRIYIPGMSEMPVWKDDNVLDLYIDYYEFLDSYKCRNYKQMSRTLSSLLKNPLFSNEYKLSKLLNINKETNGGNKSLLDMDVHYFLVAISLFQKNYDDVTHIKQFDKKIF